MNPTKIEWCDYTWNPITGCRNGCSYCYACVITNRFKKTYPNGFEPTFYPERLTQPSKIKKPAIIFVGSMCDIFSRGVKVEWVTQIIDVCEQNPQHTFIFLTKLPENYICYLWPTNCILGTSIESTGLITINRNNSLENTRASATFVSIEPLLGPVHMDLSHNHLVIVGAMTGRKHPAPTLFMLNSIKHHNIFYKENIRRYFPELPEGSKSQWGITKNKLI